MRQELNQKIQFGPKIKFRPKNASKIDPKNIVWAKNTAWVKKKLSKMCQENQKEQKISINKTRHF